ncbi:MAG: hypothetical protein ACYDA9_18150 [Terriglobia bacterium]
MISANLDSVRGECQGIPKLTLNLSVEAQSDAQLTVVNVAAAIRVTPELIERDVRKSYFIGTGFLEAGGGQLNRGSKGFWNIGVPLTPYQLQKIEEMRKGKDLFLNVQFFCTATWRLNTPPAAITEVASIAVRVGGYSDGYCPFKVPQSDWVKTLGELGYGDYFLMEIPLKGVPVRKGMEKAIEHLKAAWEHFEQGNDNETLGSCYKAFEYLAKKSNSKHPDQNAFEKILSSIPEIEKRRRLKMVMNDLCQFLCLGRHEPGTEGVILDERESEYGLILSQATLSYLAKLMRETSAK